MQLIEGAEAKAFYGLALNYKPLKALVERLLVKETLSGKEVAETLDGRRGASLPGLLRGGLPVGRGRSACATLACPHRHVSAIICLTPPELSCCMLSSTGAEAPAPAG